MFHVICQRLKAAIAQWENRYHAEGLEIDPTTLMTLRSYALVLRFGGAGQS